MDAVNLPDRQSSLEELQLWARALVLKLPACVFCQRPAAWNMWLHEGGRGNVCSACCKRTKAIYEKHPYGDELDYVVSLLNHIGPHVTRPATDDQETCVRCLQYAPGGDPVHSMDCEDCHGSGRRPKQVKETKTIELLTADQDRYKSELEKLRTEQDDLLARVQGLERDNKLLRDELAWRVENHRGEP